MDSHAAMWPLELGIVDIRTLFIVLDILAFGGLLFSLWYFSVSAWP